MGKRKGKRAEKKEETTGKLEETKVEGKKEITEEKKVEEKEKTEEAKKESTKEKKGEEDKEIIEEKKEEKKEKKKEEGNNKEVVLKVELHCEGCVMKVKKAIRAVEGVVAISIDYSKNQITVKGDVDPWESKGIIESRTKKSVEIISPKNPPMKKPGEEKKSVDNDTKDAKKKIKDKKPEEVSETTADLKMHLHCEGCIDKIRRTICRIKGVKEVMVDEAKDVVTVKGTMDVKSLPKFLQEKLKRNVEFVPSNKTEDNQGTLDTNEKEKNGNNEEKIKEVTHKKGEKKGKKADMKEEEKQKNEDEKEKEAGDQNEGNKGDKENEGIKPKIESASANDSSEMINKFDFFAPSYEYCGPVIMDAPRIFSDENPNACVVM